MGLVVGLLTLGAAHRAWRAVAVTEDVPGERWWKDGDAGATIAATPPPLLMQARARSGELPSTVNSAGLPGLGAALPRAVRAGLSRTLHLTPELAALLAFPQLSARVGALCPSVSPELLPRCDARRWDALRVAFPSALAQLLEHGNEAERVQALELACAQPARAERVAAALTAVSGTVPPTDWTVTVHALLDACAGGAPSFSEEAKGGWGAALARIRAGASVPVSPSGAQLVDVLARYGQVLGAGSTPPADARPNQ